MDLSIISKNKVQQLRSDRRMLATSDDEAMLKQVEVSRAPDGHQFAVKPFLHIIDDIFQREAPSVLALFRTQQLRSNRHLFATSDDHAMLKQVEVTHALDGLQFDVKPLLNIIEGIFQRAGLVKQGSTQARDLPDDKTFQASIFDKLHPSSSTIKKVSNEILCKCTIGGDAHATTVGIFNILGSYTWETKVVLAMAAFASNCGKLWLLAQVYPTDPLAKSVALLKQLPMILEGDNTLKSKFEALGKLIKAMLDVAKCIVEFKDLPALYITPDTPEMATAIVHIQTAVYWTIRSIVAGTAQITGIVGMGHEYKVSTAESMELSSLAHKVSSIHPHLKTQLYLCYKIIDKKRHTETYQALVRLNESPHADNMNSLRELIYDKDDQLPLVEGSTKTRVSLEVLRKRNVVLLISDLNVFPDELLILLQMYQESRLHPTRTESNFEVVWLPVVDKTAPWTKEQFEFLQGVMPWYSIHHPSMVGPAVISYFKEFCHFKKEPILVVFDLQGNVVNTNAQHMIWIWDSRAFPFSVAREDALWKEEVWGLELLTGRIDPAIPVWVDERKFVCLYGGEDMDWIRKFTKTAQTVAQAIGLPLEMLYVGMSNPKDHKVKSNIATITAENLSHALKDIPLILLFWVRLESMWHSKMQQSSDVEKDPILLEIAKILSFDGSKNCWAGIYRGSEMAKAKGETILKSFDDFHLWKKNANDISFIPALNQRLSEVYSPNHCNHLILSGTIVTIPERVVCSECNCQMKKFIMYRCCND